MSTLYKNYSKKLLWILVLIIATACNQSFNPTLQSMPTEESIKTGITKFPPTEITEATPLPTLNSEKAQVEIKRLMQTNNSCSEICFWGIVPGKSLFDETVSFLQTFKKNNLSNNEKGETQYNDSFRYDDGNMYLSILITNHDGLVNDLQATIMEIGKSTMANNKWGAFRPDNIMRVYGIPDQVSIWTAEGPEGRMSYGFSLLFEKTLIEYSSNQIIYKPEHIIHACPLEENNIERIDINLFSVNSAVSNIQRIGNLAKLTGINEKDFYGILTGDPDLACFDIDTRK